MFRWGLLIIVLSLIYVVYNQYPRLNIVAGYSAKNMNSSIFLAGRTFHFTDQSDNNFSPVNLASDTYDKREMTTEASVYGLLTRKAIYRDGLGSVLVPKDSKENTIYSTPKRVENKTNLPFPYGELPQKDTIFKHIEYNTLANVVEMAFDSLNKTRAVLVIHKDQLIAEKYADGFDQNSIILGWSMTKSITGTIMGILQSQELLNVNDKAPVDSWKNDERSEITIHNLLQMNSGLEWVEDYNNISDVTKMLFISKNMGAVQEDKHFVGKPNETWNYSSGTTNLLSNISRSYFDTHQSYLNFWYSDLIDKIGMHSMTIEADFEGNYVGSSYGWATPRDWAKLGLLYLHHGSWNGDQVFDASWVKYATTPTNTSNGRYGAHIWLNAGGYYPDLPKDLYSFNGYQGQRVFIIPSKDLVIVRMGLSTMDFNQFLKNILSAIH
ncbi:MAG: serine hydrolase [Flavobacteriaceae bacterium]|nr:serine hydrolase [Flavobacteriaceae bacterium]